MPLFSKRKNSTDSKDKQNTDERNQEQQQEKERPVLISPSLAKNIAETKKEVGSSSDVIIREIKIGEQDHVHLAVIYIAGLVDNNTIHESLIDPLVQDESIQNTHAIQQILEKTLPLGGVKAEKSWDKLFSELMLGNALIFADGHDEALICSTQGGEQRSIQEPSTQVSFRGPRQGFTESLQTNISMIRRYIKNPNLWVEKMKKGSVTNTDIALMYIQGICDEKVLKEVKQRLEKIDIDSILESGYIEQLIEDETFTTFPTMYHTERPDVVAGNLLEGRFAIIVDGTPFVLIAPALFVQFFQSVEDYYSRFDIATSIRILRVLVFFISLVAPAVYVAATTFHQEMIPTQLLVVIAAQREIVPFPAVVEALTMEVAFEILREAGVRLPRVVGSAVSIVGALVIGQAAVQAGIVSPAMVIIVALTAIASFATPAFAMAISARLIRFIFIIASAVMGFYGLILGIIMMFVHLCSLRSFGVPYMSPLAPFSSQGVKDALFRVPWWADEKRPESVSKEDKVRQGKDQRPEPAASRGMVNKDLEEGDQNGT
ncbi:spore germination protein GerKA [Bacillus subtilis]|jgi:spore germination protein KA|uniref:spore germination protein GerKA n=1 Tax=Bacillus TaxID=1386 RepID=UPI000DC43752|nr:spore germination protein GerKA [Bacillus subtilis]MCM3385557.1 spore germination protein GerKA [Bacillus subtilis]MDI6581687.1 spore germination protein GerKA [Bacillus subtilis]MDI6590438.1 spore germination protein GerKA [Bacillus subtilis]MDM5459744.1 spore germination protein GerKA [Bacillus subtilis]MDW4547072.1 spore germination protein GerKA [Bacillus subtilis subsp. subtilis]